MENRGQIFPGREHLREQTEGWNRMVEAIRSVLSTRLEEV